MIIIREHSKDSDTRTAISDKSHYTYDYNDIHEDDNPLDGSDEKNEFTQCFLPFFVMSTCMFLLGNYLPEHCFRKKTKHDKTQDVLVEKDCGCTIVYNTIKEP